MANPSSGVELTSGITSGLALNTLVKETLAFIRDELPRWRDDPERADESVEENLNLQLCKYLNVRARHDFPMAHFNHEEKQAPQRRIDLSVTPDSLIVAGTRPYTKYDPYLVIEGKRLPAPTSNREKEYVTGIDKITGGLQRFKLGLHGGKLQIAAMVAYVQDDSPDTWIVTINGWITSLNGSDCAQGCVWSSSEKIEGYRLNKRTRVATGTSKHPRTAAMSPEIIIHHFWVSMRRTRRRAKKGGSGKP